MRIFALSDLHVDFADNRHWLESLSWQDYRQDVLICAGDISHQRDHLVWAMETLLARFARVFFIPGNHDLWLNREQPIDSLDKWWDIRELCKNLGVEVNAARLAQGPWIVPLLSWYTLPREGDDSLARGRLPAEGDLAVWSDTHLVRWPVVAAESPAAHLTALNSLPDTHDAPVISFSHFLPRAELLQHRWPGAASALPSTRRVPFNFSWVAGSQLIEAQLRTLGSSVHIYGHQHRNRRRLLEQVLYIAHCLGYPRERQRGEVIGVDEGPLLVWDTDIGASPVIPWDGEALPL